MTLPSFGYVKPSDCLLDLGVGTGLASHSFAQLGLIVYGCDGSAEMLKICESKAFAKELKVVDLRNIPLPYADHSFNHVICCGVLHFFDDLEVIMKEVRRIIKPGGVFAFTVAAQTSKEESVNNNKSQKYLQVPTSFGISIFKHGSQYISKTLRTYNFEVLKKQQLVIRDCSGENNVDMLFNALVTRS